MIRTFVVLCSLAAAAVLAPSTVVAGVQSPLTAAQRAAQTSPAIEVQFWDMGRCRAWRRECADRWGWRTERWYRCLARHGCERHRYGDQWD